MFSKLAVSAAHPPSSAAGVEVGEEAIVNVSSLDVRHPERQIGDVSVSAVRFQRWTSSARLTVLSVSGRVGRWCRPALVSASCSFGPAASPTGAPRDPSLLGLDRAFPFPAVFPTPSSEDARIKKKRHEDVHTAASTRTRHLKVTSRSFTFFSSAWYFWNWTISCWLSAGGFQSDLAVRPGIPTTLGLGGSSAPSSCPFRPFSSACAQFQGFNSLSNLQNINVFSQSRILISSL